RSLRLFARLRNCAADAPPKVNFVFEVKGKDKIAFTVIGIRSIEVRLIGGVANRANARSGRDCGRLRRTVEAHRRACRAKIGLRLFQRLVGWLDLCFKGVEL